MTQTQIENKYGVKPGDIFFTSWGYDQTNIDFYKVVRVTKAKAEIVPIGAKRVDERGTSNILIPDPDFVREWDVLIGINRSDEKKSKLCTITSGYKGRPSIVLQSGRHWAWPHEGDRTYAETDAHFGH
jgi:hypothetical protein